VRRVSRFVLTIVLVGLLNYVLFLPRVLWPNRAAGSNLVHPMNRPLVVGIGYELGVLLAIVVLAASSERWRRPVRIAATYLVAAFLLVSTYHEAYLYVFFNDPAVVDDWRLLLNLAHFLPHAGRETWIKVIGGVVGWIAAIALAAWTFQRVQEATRLAPLRRRAIAGGTFVVLGALLLVTFRWPPHNRFVQQLSDGIVVNIGASRIALANWRAIFDQPIDTRNDVFASAPMEVKPNVYLVLFEAYGEILATCTSKTAYRSLLARMEAILAESGFRARSAYSIASIYGGRSWLSIATIQTGIHIDSQPTFRVFEQNAARIPTLTSFFKAHGYQTLMLQPWDQERVGLPREDVYRRDVAVIRTDLPYEGPPSGITGVPDQWAVEYFDHTYLRGARQPRFVSYMATATHFDWPAPPPIARDWRALERALDPDDIEPWEPIPGTEAITDPVLARYFATVVYEWRVLARYIAARREENALFVIVGDHQPFLKCGDATSSFHTPVHILARDPALLDRFADAGLAAGLHTDSDGCPRLKHEGLFSLLAATLTGTAARFPNGISLSGLRR
jgi:hypothetical protein